MIAQDGKSETLLAGWTQNKWLLLFQKWCCLFSCKGISTGEREIFTLKHGRDVKARVSKPLAGTIWLNADNIKPSFTVAQQKTLFPMDRNVLRPGSNKIALLISITVTLVKECCHCRGIWSWGLSEVLLPARSSVKMSSSPSFFFLLASMLPESIHILSDLKTRWNRSSLTCMIKTYSICLS